jgi:hypothetical protein
VEKVTTLAEIRAGDSVRTQLGGRTQLVLEASGNAEDAKRHLILSPEEGVALWYEAAPDTPIILVRRPRPRGKKEQDMLDRVRYRARLAAEDQKTYNLEQLREAIDAYELGKPFDSTQGKSEA